MLCPHGRRVGYVWCSVCHPKFNELQAIMIGWMARREGARWESPVEEYCLKCGGNAEDTRVVISSIRPAVMRDEPPTPAGVVPEREVIRLSGWTLECCG